jgi:hypothetical protein
MCLSHSSEAPISKSPMRKYYRRSSSRFGRTRFTLPRGDMFLQPLCIGLGLMPMQCIARLPGVRVLRADPFAAMLQWLFHTLQTNGIQRFYQSEGRTSQLFTRAGERDRRLPVRDWDRLSHPKGDFHGQGTTIRRPIA